MEVITNIRTVASLGTENLFNSKYESILFEYFNQAKRGGHFQGFSLGIARSMMFVAYGAALFYGGTLVINEGLEYSKVIKYCRNLIVKEIFRLHKLCLRVAQILISGAWSMGAAIAFTPNFLKAIGASKKIVQLLNRKPLIRNAENCYQFIWVITKLLRSNSLFVHFLGEWW